MDIKKLLMLLKEAKKRKLLRRKRRVKTEGTERGLPEIPKIKVSVGGKGEKEKVPVGPIIIEYKPIKLPEVEEKEEVYLKDVSSLVLPKEIVEKLKKIHEKVPLIYVKLNGEERLMAWGEIKWSEDLQSLIYEVKEPKLNEKEKKILEELKTYIEEKLDIDFRALRNIEEANRYIMEKMKEGIKKMGYKLSRDQMFKILYYLQRDLVGLEKIEPLMRDPDIEDISCDGVGIPVFIYHRNPMYGEMPTNIVFNSKEELDNFIIKLAQKAGRAISVANPLLDGSLPDGSRVQATFGTDIARRGSNFTIRKFFRRVLTPIDLLEYGTVNELILAYYWLAVESKMSMLIAGPTASGKTTLLNAISLFIRPEMKIISIEDTAELRLPHPNWVPHVSRAAFGPSGYGAVTMFDLLKAALRQRPDYIIVGEVRGKEAYVMFQAMASVSRDTPILIREDGKVKLVKIGDFVDKFYKKGEERVPKSLNAEVLTITKEGVGFSKMLYVLRHKEKELIRIQVSGGGEIKVTPNHSVFVLDKKTLEPKLMPAEKIKEGDFLITFVGSQKEFDYHVYDLAEFSSKRWKVEGKYLKYRKKRIPRYITLDERLGYLFGVYLADGYVTDNTYLVFSLGKREKEIIEKTMKYMEEIFGISPYVEDRGSYKLIRYCCKPVARFFSKILGKKLSEKKIPSEIFSSPPSVVEEFFKGYMADAKRTLKRNYTCYSTKKKELAIQLLWLARLYGFYSFLSKGKDMYDVGIYFKETKKAIQGIGIPSSVITKIVKSLPKELSYIRKRKFVGKEVLRKIIDRAKSKEEKEKLRKLLELFSKEYKIAVVKRIERIKYNDYVYDVSVPEVEAFFGGEVPVLLHNTGHACYGTIHADSLDAIINRLITPPINLPKQMITNLDLITFLIGTKLRGKFVRRVDHIVEITGYNYKEDEILTNTSFIWDPVEDKFISRSSYLLDKIGKRLGYSEEELEEEIKRRIAVLKWMRKKGIRKYDEFWRIIGMYYYNPVKLFDMIRRG